MQNFYPVPLSYEVGASGGDDDNWTGRLVGILFVLLGVVTLTAPLFVYLRPSTRVILGVFGAPIMVRGVPTLIWSVAEGGALLLVGVGILSSRRWAFFVGMLFALRLLLTGGPTWWILGTLMLLTLWSGLPEVRSRSEP